MSKFWHGVLQVLGVVVQGANLLSNIVPTKYQPLVAASTAALQAGLALSQHGGGSGQVSK